MKKIMILMFMLSMFGCNSNDFNNVNRSSTEQLTRSVFTNSSYIEEKVLSGDFSKNSSLDVFTNSSVSE